VEDAVSIGLVDDVILRDDLSGGPFEGFRDQVERIAEDLSQGARYGRLVAQKQATRQRDEHLKPLADYRREELQQMSTNFWGDDRGYHIARAAFVRKQSPDAEGAVAADRRLAVVSS
jgi:putative two-component system hydrogenase maturation factor HypX/HoxX